MSGPPCVSANPGIWGSITDGGCRAPEGVVSAAGGEMSRNRVVDTLGEYVDSGTVTSIGRDGAVEARTTAWVTGSPFE